MSAKQLLYCSVLAVLSFFAACIPDENADLDCLSDNISSLYESDAIRLSLRLQQNSPLANNIELPEAQQERVLRALGVLHKSDLVQRDSVLEMYNVHTLPYPAFDEITLQVDTNTTWVHEWMADKRLTGNPSVDNLMNSYNLQMDGFFSLSVNFVILSSEKPLNMAALAAAFEDIQGIVDTDYEQSGGDGNDIVAQDFGSTLRLTYTVGYDQVGSANNCNGSCEFSRSWVFDVSTPSDNSCGAASFVESYGDAAP